MVKGIVMQVRYQAEFLPFPASKTCASKANTIRNTISRGDKKNDWLYDFYHMKVLIEFYVHNFLRKNCSKRKSSDKNCFCKMGYHLSYLLCLNCKHL